MDSVAHIAWFIIVFVIVVFALYALRPSFLLENCECDDRYFQCNHCEIHPLLAIWAAIMIALIVIIVQWYICRI